METIRRNMCYLKHSEASLEEAVKGRPWTFYQEFSTKKLHPKKSKDENEENKKNQQSHNGRYRVDQWLDQVTHSWPVSEEEEKCFFDQLFKKDLTLSL